MSHTPGPWEVVFDGALAAHKEHWRVISATSGLTLAVVEFGRAAEANARLIAKAPDLRAALEDLAQTLALLLPNVENNHVSVSVDEAALRRKLQQARAALAGARKE